MKLEREEDKTNNKFDDDGNLQCFHGDLFKSFARSMGSLKMVDTLFHVKYSDQDILVLSHNDPDGHCSSAIVANEIGMDNMTIYNIDGYTYDWKLIDEQLKKATMIFITDLSLNQDSIDYITNHSTAVIVWLDHHESSKSVNVNKDRVYKWIYSEIGISACMVVYAYFKLLEFYEDASNVYVNYNDFINATVTLAENKTHIFYVPRIIRLISLYDTFHDDMSLPFIYGLASETININSDEGKEFWKHTLARWDDTGESIINNIIKKGEIIETYLFGKWAGIRKSQMAEIHVVIKDGEQEYTRTLAILNINEFSMAFGPALEEYDGCIRYYQKADGTWTYSIYSSKLRKTSIDCCKFATALGGGGHKHAAGWNNANNMRGTVLKDNARIVYK